VKRGEGIWRMQDGFAFTCTEGGPIGSGQVFHLAPTKEGGTLRLLAQSRNERVLDMPDNLTLTPWGDLLVCEDNHRNVFLRLITQRGEVVPFAHNSASRSEFAGVCFSPDGKVLFVNIQEAGVTLAIEGDWEKFRAGRA
jgi:secreted PhoX family phosphatase